MIALYEEALATLEGDSTLKAQLLAQLAVELMYASTHDPDAATVLGVHIATVRWAQGRMDEVAVAMQQLVETQPHNKAWRAALANTYGEMERLDDAREHFDILAGRKFNVGRDWSWSSGAEMVLCAIACASLRDRNAAPVLYAYLEPFAGQVAMAAGVVNSYGSFALPCGMLAAVLERWDEAERHFTAAVEMDERIGARPWLVRTRRAWAEMLLERNAPGDVASARDLVATGRAEADELGMALELVRFERLAVRLAST